MTAADVEASLRTLLPDVPVEDLARLATLVADIVGGVLPPEAARSRLAADPCSALLQLLAGRSIGVGTSVINFGTSNNFRDVAFGSVAGHDVVNITFNLNIAGPTTTQTTDPRAFDLIDTIRATVRADQFDERIGEAEDALDRREYPGARALVKRLRDRQWEQLSGPQKYKVLAILARVALAEGKFQDAGRLLLDARPFQTGDERHRTNEAVAHELLGETGRAFELACAIRRDFPDSARGLALWLRTASTSRACYEL